MNIYILLENIGMIAAICAMACLIPALGHLFDLLFFKRRRRAKEEEGKCIDDPTPESKSLGWEMIKAERKRQIDDEGWTAEHDDSHGRGELAAAALCYEDYGDYINGPEPTTEWTWETNWPWDRRWFKRDTTGPMRNWVKAGALYLAEAERYLRKAQPDMHNFFVNRAKAVAAKIDVELAKKGAA